MSSFANNEIDPRLRDIASSGFSQQPSQPPQPPPFQQFHPSQPFQLPLATSPVGPPQQQFASPPIANPNPNTFPQTPTPQSAGGSASDLGGSQQGGTGTVSKRRRACESCRALKVCCKPVDNNPSVCERCAKASRPCVTSASTRKRQKKSDSRVADLEKKIDHLTQTLAQKNGGAFGIAAGGFEPAGDFDHPVVEPRRNAYQQVTNGNAFDSIFTKPDARSEDWAGYDKRPESGFGKDSAPPMVMAGLKRKHWDYSSRKGSEATSSLVDAGNRAPLPHEYADVIDRGLLTAEMADKMFEYYVMKMVPQMPAVVFPAGTTAADIRKTKPVLFLAILSAASGSNYPELRRLLTKELMNTFAERVIGKGEKSLELIQALHVSTLWYSPPEHFEELKFYQLIHIAAVMALDIGMGKHHKSPKGKSVGLWRDHPWRGHPYPDPESIEAMRTWLTCYYLCCNAAMGLRRENLIRWSSFMGICIGVLETSSDAAPTDKILCQWVRIQHIAEDIGTHFSMDDPSANVSITDTKTQDALKGFESDLENWSKNIPTEADTPILRVTQHVVNLYMHEISMHVDGDKDQSLPLSQDHIAALSTCLGSIDKVFEIFLQFDVETIRCLPVANFVRVAYAVIVLIKMYFAAAQPNNNLGKVINKDNMKAEQYLDGLVTLLKASTAEEKSRSSGKILMALLMLKTWFHRQREVGHPVPPTEAAPKMGNQGEPSAAANTALELLSQVATGVNQSRAGTMVTYPGGNNEWQQPPPQLGYQSYAPMSNSGLDFGYTFGGGLEQAIGMPPGLGDFGTIFNDDSFFSGFMESFGHGESVEENWLI